MGYPTDILGTRAIVRPNYAVVPAAGLVNNVVPGIENCRISIVASPKIGAGFVQYIIEAALHGGTSKPFGQSAGIECFLFCIEGEGWAAAGEEKITLTPGAYVFAPAGIGLSFQNTADTKMKLILYKQRYIPIENHSAWTVFGNVNDIPFRPYDDMDNLLIKDLLPVNLGFDLNFHILSFLPGACHPFAETHVQEHGAYILTGEGCYYLDDNWGMIKKGDFVWFGPYCPQAAYGVGREDFTYIYSKDCNRDPEL